MDIRFTQRLSYKQARLTVLVGFVLGTLLSLMQIGIDYASEDASINREILSLLEISHNPASRIAYNIDAELAQELRSEEHTSELQSLMRISYAVFCLKKKKLKLKY